MVGFFSICDVQINQPTNQSINQSTHLVRAKQKLKSAGYPPFQEIRIRASTVATLSVDRKSHLILFRQELPLSQQTVWTGITRQSLITSGKLGKWACI